MSSNSDSHQYVHPAEIAVQVFKGVHGCSSSPPCKIILLSHEGRATCNLHNVSERLPVWLLFLSEAYNTNIRALGRYKRQKWCYASVFLTYYMHTYHIHTRYMCTYHTHITCIHNDTYITYMLYTCILHMHITCMLHTCTIACILHIHILHA